MNDQPKNRLKKKSINYNPNTALIQGAAAAYRNYDNVAGMYQGLENTLKKQRLEQ